jgi:hypothetical protein
VPLLVYAVGMTVQEAAAISLVVVAVSSLFGAWEVFLMAFGVMLLLAPWLIVRQRQLAPPQSEERSRCVESMARNYLDCSCQSLSPVLIVSALESNERLCYLISSIPTCPRRTL